MFVSWFGEKKWSKMKKKKNYLFSGLKNFYGENTRNN